MKEFLAILFACTKFHQYIYGHKVTLWTDHKPLTAIMVKKFSEIASPRLQRIKLKLLKYQLHVNYMPGKHLHVADLLSRDFIKENQGDDPSMLEVVHNIKAVVNITDNKILEFQSKTDKDPVLSIIKNYCTGCWPAKCSNVNLLPYFNIKNDISVLNGILLYTNKLIVPKLLRNKMIAIAHEGHFGISKTLNRAKESFFWPLLRKDVLQYVNSCKDCEKYKPKNCKEPLISHDIPNKPFSKVASDLCEYGKQSYLVIYDYYSKWLEVLPVKSKTSEEVIRKFKYVFATHGIPDILVADNMPYASYEFKKFSDTFKFQVVTSSPHYAKSNGFAEAGVKIAKSLLKKGSDLDVALLNYRTSQITGVGYSPSELLMGRKLKTKLPVSHKSLLDPVNTSKGYEKILNKQKLAKQYYDTCAKERQEFSAGDNVTINRDGIWEPAQIINKCNEPRSYIVKTENGTCLRRNSVHLRKSMNEPRFNQINVDFDNRSSDDSGDITTVTDPKPKYEPRSSRPRVLPARYNDYILN